MERVAELAEKYLKKGHKIYVEGRLKKRSWQDKEGNTDIVLRLLLILTMLSKPTQQDSSTAPYLQWNTTCSNLLA